MESRVALVTGGTGGIGSAIVKRLARMGHRVATNYRDEAKARKWQEQARAEGLEILIVPGDVANPESAAAMVDAVRGALGPVDILVNNAGITRDTTFHRMSALQWQEVINTNLNSCFNVTRPVIDGMRERKWGRIIQISSINGQKGQYGQANYAASKAGMHGFTISLAQENAQLRHHRQHGVAGLHRHRHGHGGAGGSARQDRRQHPHRPPRHAGGDRLRRRRSSCPTRPRGSPAPTCRSTAATTWVGSPCRAHAMRARASRAAGATRQAAVYGRPLSPAS